LLVKKYKVGYVPGGFDLFHIGHLNLLRRSKEHCEYLIAGVVTDELLISYKHKKPCIPFEERFAIVEAIKYVDEVVKVDFVNTDKITAWHMYHYDCHFCGDDHINDLAEIQRKLKELGADMMFFEYTKANNSTNIRKAIADDIFFDKTLELNKNKNIVAFGAGAIFDAFMKKYGETFKPAFIVDNDPKKWGTFRCGAAVQKPESLLAVPKDNLFVIVCSVYYRQITAQLQNMGIFDYHVYSEN